jgi:hypothetical protein
VGVTSVFLTSSSNGSRSDGACNSFERADFLSEELENGYHSFLHFSQRFSPAFFAAFAPY